MLKKWNNENRDIRNASSKAYKTKKINRKPVWANKKKMICFYREAKKLTQETGTPHHVDHIVPLRSAIVSGLHCEANLQVITWRDNVVKGNRYWPDMP
jgi:hypothetical protein